VFRALLSVVAHPAEPSLGFGPNLLEFPAILSIRASPAR